MSPVYIPAVILREKFDYTKWRRQYFDDMDPDAFNNAAADYARKNPFVPKHIENANWLLRQTFGLADRSC